MTAQKRCRGRPARAGAAGLTLSVRFTPAERALLQDASAALDGSISELVRAAALQAAGAWAHKLPQDRRALAEATRTLGAFVRGLQSAQAQAPEALAVAEEMQSALQRALAEPDVPRATRTPGRSAP